jgi:hypothetical protein
MYRIGTVVLLSSTMSLFLALAGCGDDDDDNGVGTPCEQLINDICAAACECADDCAWSVSGMGSSSSDFDTCYDMEMSFGTCDGLEMDFDACSTSISQDLCVDGSFGPVLELEEVCDDLAG